MKRDMVKAQYIIPGIGLVMIFTFALLQVSGIGGGASPTGSIDPGGYLLFYELLEQLDFSIQRWYADSPPNNAGCLVYLDYDEADRGRILQLQQWVTKGNTLVMAGLSAGTDPVTGRAVTVEKDVTFSLPEWDEEIRSASLLHIKGKTSDTVHVKSPNGPLWISFPYGKGRIHLIPDHFLFVNRNFKKPDVALLVSTLLYPYRDQKIYVQDELSFDGSGSNPIAILFRGDLLLVTLHIVLLGILFALMSAKRFARPVVADPFKRRSLAAHIQGIGHFFRKARALDLVNDISVRYVQFRLKKLLGIKGNPSEEELLERLRGVPHLPEGYEEHLRVSGFPKTEDHLLEKTRNAYRAIEELEQSQIKPKKMRKS